MKTQTKSLLSTMSLLLTTQAAHSNVNMRDASFFDSTIDAQSTHLNLIRHYSSRSRFEGMFGYGWCTQYESYRQKSRDGRWELFECGPNGGMQKRTSSDRTSDDLEIDYDDRGRVKQLRRTRGLLETITILRDDLDRIREIQSSTGAKIVLTYLMNERRVSASYLETLDGKTETTKYGYRDSDLIEAQKNSHLINYRYDDLHNLTLIEETSRPAIKIAYDDATDRVLSFEKGNCKETYSYSDPERKTLHAYSEAKLTCGNSTEPIKQSRFEFYYANRKDGAVYLSKIKMKNGNEQTEVFFTPNDGRKVRNTSRKAQ